MASGAVVMTTAEMTPAQSELLETFLQAWDSLKESTLEAARAYKECIDAGIDMRRYIRGHSVHEKLLVLASGKLVPLKESEILFMPAFSVRALASLPKEEQKLALTEGIKVHRHGKVEQIPFVRLSATEVRGAIDMGDGQGRILTPEEQEVREVAPNRKGQIIEVRLNYAEAKAMMTLAEREGSSPEEIIRELLREKGVVD
jgi:hypothetical protein